MEGYKTIIFMLIGLLSSIGAQFGIIIPENEQSALMAGIIAIGGLILRLMTKTPVGVKKADVVLTEKASGQKVPL